MNPLVYTDPVTARKVVDVAASLSRLGEAPERLGREMLLSNSTGVEPTLTDLGQVRAALDEIDAVAVGVAGHPGAYVRAVARGQRAVLSILERQGRDYLSLVRDIIEVDFRLIPASEAQRLRATLEDGLGELGYRGDLRARVDAWLADTSLTGDAVIEFGRAILERARADTIAKVTPLPPGEGVDSLTGVRNVFYSGRSKYTGGGRGWLHFNVDKHWQRDVFVQVLCHEAYPGHQTFYSLWDAL